MGIYLFNRDTLVDVLEKTDYHDFGNEIFPASIRTRHVQLHLFDGYWEDIGTIRSFYDANLRSPSRTRRSSWPRPPRRSTPAPASCRRRASTAPRSSTAWSPTAARSAPARVIENSVIGLRCRIGRT